MIDSIEKYRIFDLTILSILAIGAEILGHVLHIKLPGAGYYLSFAILIAIVAMIRWGAFGAAVYVIAGITMIFMNEGPVLESILLYPFSYAFIGLSAVSFKFVNRHKMKDNIFVLLVFSIIAHISVSVGKGLAMYLLTGDFIDSFIYFNLTQLFSMVIVGIVLVVIKNKKGLLVDMKQYLIEMNS